MSRIIRYLRYLVPLLLLITFITFKVKNNSYYNFEKNSITWLILVKTNNLVNDIPIVLPIDKVTYNYIGYDSYNIDMREIQLNYHSKKELNSVLSIILKYFKKNGFTLKKSNGVFGTYELPSHESDLTQYYFSIENNKQITIALTPNKDRTTSVSYYFIE